jgi:hypothetical protein
MHVLSLKAYSEERKTLDDRTLKIHRHILGERLTDRQVKDELGFTDMNQVRPRISELIKSGWADQVGSVKDEETGKTVRIVTGRSVRRPVQEVKPRTFWGVKRAGEIGDLLSSKKQAMCEHANESRHDLIELIELREVLRKKR